MQCASGEQCFYGSCFPIGSFGFAEFGFSAFAQQNTRAVGAGGLNSTYALEGNLTAEGLVPLPPSQLTDGLPAWGKLKNGSSGGGGGGGMSGSWWRRRRRRGGKTNSSGLVGASAGGSTNKPPNYDDDSEFYDDLAAIVEPYRAYMDLRPVEMRPELLSAAPSSVATRGGNGGLVGASAGDSASPHGDVALFPSYNPKTVAAVPSSIGAGSSLLGGAPGEKRESSFFFLFYFILASEGRKTKNSLFFPLQKNTQQQKHHHHHHQRRSRQPHRRGPLRGLPEGPP